MDFNSYQWQAPECLALLPDLQAILLSTAPTTPRLRRISQSHLQIIVLQQGWHLASPQEASCLGLISSKVWQRSVVLRDREHVWMYARAIVAAHHLGGSWRKLRRLGNQSLGLWLQSCAAWNRSEFVLAQASDHWARRSVFTASHSDKQLVLIEQFMPAVIQAFRQLPPELISSP